MKNDKDISPIDRVTTYTLAHCRQMRGWNKVENGFNFAGFVANTKDLATVSGYAPLRQVKHPARFALVVTSCNRPTLSRSTSLYLSIWAIPFQTVAIRYGFFQVNKSTYACATCGALFPDVDPPAQDAMRDHYQAHHDKKARRK